MNLDIFIAIFTVIFLAELPDKTAFATFMMATRGKPLAIFMGVALAFVVQSLIAVGFGSFIGLLPEKWVHIGAGVLFLGFAAYTWFFHDKDEEEEEKEVASHSYKAAFLIAMWRSFVVIFIAEWGDVTQLVTASLAARYHAHPYLVFSSATLALWAVTAIAVVAGKRVGHVVHVGILKKISVVLFSAIGLYFIVQA